MIGLIITTIPLWDSGLSVYLRGVKIQSEQFHAMNNSGDRLDDSSSSPLSANGSQQKPASLESSLRLMVGSLTSM